MSKVILMVIDYLYTPSECSVGYIMQCAQLSIVR